MFGSHVAPLPVPFTPSDDPAPVVSVLEAERAEARPPVGTGPRAEAAARQAGLRALSTFDPVQPMVAARPHPVMQLGMPAPVWQSPLLEAAAARLIEMPLEALCVPVSQLSR